MEEIYADLKTEKELKNKNGYKNDKNDVTGKQRVVTASDLISENDDTQNNENRNNGNQANIVNKYDGFSADLGPDSSLAVSFSRAAERCLPELSHAETFQVCCVGCTVWGGVWVW